MDRPTGTTSSLLAGFVIFVAASVVLIRWRPPLELTVYTLAMGAFAFTSTRVGFRPRTFLAAFPLSMALGVKMRRGPWFALGARGVGGFAHPARVRDHRDALHHALIIPSMTTRAWP